MTRREFWCVCPRAPNESWTVVYDYERWIYEDELEAERSARVFAVVAGAFSGVVTTLVLEHGLAPLLVWLWHALVS